MARPTKNDIDSGIQGWDGKIDDNDEAVFNTPIPIHEHTGDESDIASTFSAAAYDRCLVWVDHTVMGWTLYWSDGTIWSPYAKGPIVYGAENAGDQSGITAGAVITFDTEKSDPDSSFASSTLTVKHAGLLVINFNCAMSETSGTQDDMEIRCRVDTVIEHEAIFRLAANENNVPVSLSMAFPVASGEAIDFYIGAFSSSTVTVRHASFNAVLYPNA